MLFVWLKRNCQKAWDKFNN